jgi:hypothetical protein
LRVVGEISPFIFMPGAGGFYRMYVGCTGTPFRVGMLYQSKGAFTQKTDWATFWAISYKLIWST